MLTIIGQCSRDIILDIGLFDQRVFLRGSIIAVDETADRIGICCSRSILDTFDITVVFVDVLDVDGQMLLVQRHFAVVYINDVVLQFIFLRRLDLITSIAIDVLRVLTIIGQCSRDIILDIGLFDQRVFLRGSIIAVDETADRIGICCSRSILDTFDITVVFVDVLDVDGQVLLVQRHLTRIRFYDIII